MVVSHVFFYALLMAVHIVSPLPAWKVTILSWGTTGILAWFCFVSRHRTDGYWCVFWQKVGFHNLLVLVFVHILSRIPVQALGSPTRFLMGTFFGFFCVYLFSLLNMYGSTIISTVIAWIKYKAKRS